MVNITEECTLTFHKSDINSDELMQLINDNTDNEFIMFFTNENVHIILDTRLMEALLQSLEKEKLIIN